MVRTLYPIGARWSGLGFNYGNDRAFSNYYDLSKIRAELRFLRRFTDKLRIFIPAYGYGVTHTLVLNCVSIIDEAKALNFYVVWGITCSESTMTSSTYPAYVTAAVARATLAAAHHVDEFAVGNEEEYHVDGTTMTAAQMTTKMRGDIVASVRPAFSGTITYNLPEGNLTDWISNGTGTLDTVGLNVYGASEYDGAGFCHDILKFSTAFGGQGYISEFGINFNWSSVTMSDKDQERELRKRVRFIQKSGVTAAYFFLFSHISDDQFAVKLANGDFRSMWFALVKQRRWFTGLPNVPIR